MQQTICRLSVILTLRPIYTYIGCSKIITLIVLDADNLLFTCYFYSLKTRLVNTVSNIFLKMEFLLY